MKRRISKTTHKDPSPIGPLLQPGHPGFRSSDFLNPNPQGTKGSYAPFGSNNNDKCIIS